MKKWFPRIFWPAMMIIMGVMQVWNGYLLLFPTPTVLYVVQSEKCGDYDKSSFYYHSMDIAAEDARARMDICDEVALAKMTIKKQGIDVHQYFDWSRPKDDDARPRLEEMGWRDGRGN